MKTIFTSLMILMINFAFAQAPLYTYNDANGNQYEVYASYVKRIPVAATSTASKLKTTTPNPEKSVETTKEELKALKLLFETAISTTADQSQVTTSPAIKYTKDGASKTIYMKGSAATKTALQDKLVSILSR